ncbi:MAG: hypothetical protein J6A03_07035 [Lachnospiraceae bacterium]|nr:hypothetical protein [Lachnospiraceae bacterium]
MLFSAEQISQPYSGEYEEKIYDIESNWNSSDWTWIKFEEETSIWCGEFRGKYIGVAFSNIKGIIVVLTSDYIYVIDAKTKEIIDSDRNFEYCDITCTPLGDVLLSSGYGLEILWEKTISSIETIVLPVNADSLRFIGYTDNVLEMNCYEFCNWSNNVTLFFDCKTKCVER